MIYASPGYKRKKNRIKIFIFEKIKEINLS